MGGADNPAVMSRHIVTLNKTLPVANPDHPP
jgi:hypothetical protein